MTASGNNVVIRIEPLDVDTWEEAAKLSIRPDQDGFVAPNVYSIAESRYHPELQPHAIYADEEMVGFAMYARNPQDNQYWIYRFMIDQRFQRRGYGLRAFTQLVEKLFALPDVPEINISYDDDNEPARQLYGRAGFIEGDMAPWGERTARITADKRPG